MLVGRTVAFFLVLFAAACGAYAGDVRTIRGPADVQGLVCADADGDGVFDLLLIEGRVVSVYRGVKEDLPAAEPTWQVTLDSSAAFVDTAPDVATAGPGLYVLGREGLHRVDLETGDATPVAGIDTRLGWADSRKAAFVDFAAPSGNMLLPNEVGFCHARPTEDGMDIRCLEAQPYLEVEAPGAFLEDMARVVDARDHIRVGAPPEGAPADAPPALDAGRAGDRHLLR